MLQFIKSFVICCCCLLFTLSSATAKQQEKPLRIAVAANFAPTLKKILPSFSKQTGIKYQVISAASGTLYQQINHGAPFDLFLSADNVRPKRLEQEQRIVAKSRQTYAYGQLALWSAKNKIANLQPLMQLSGRLAIANPDTAPYGLAAKQALTSLSLWSKVRTKLVTGININQTFQQVRSQAVPLGIVAYSQLKLNGFSGFLLPENSYRPISQQLVILKSSQQVDAAKQFVQFLLHEQQQQQLQALGYLPAQREQE